MTVAASLLVSCQKDPDWDELDSEYIVYTQKDASFDFGADKHPTYFIPDSILVIGDWYEPEYMKGYTADEIISAVTDNMNRAGYQRVEKKEEASLGIQLSYISNTYYFTGYTASPYWWWGYPGYWSPWNYWGGWGYWGYSFPVTYSYSDNSLLGEILDLNAPEGEDKELPVVWNMYINGDVSGSVHFDCHRMVRGVNQAFEQSEYLGK